MYKIYLIADEEKTEVMGLKTLKEAKIWAKDIRDQQMYLMIAGDVNCKAFKMLFYKTIFGLMPKIIKIEKEVVKSGQNK